MQPGKRVDIIKRVTDKLEPGNDWDEIDLVLEQFGFPTTTQWGRGKRSYIIHFLKRGGDDNLDAIDQYLMGHSRPDDEPWSDGGFRLFLTHVVSQKRVAHSLKTCLRFYGIDALVAHDDIAAGKEWKVVIESALYSCDALAGLLHKGFRESDWCDQEVGMDIGRGIALFQSSSICSHMDFLVPCRL